MNQDRLVSAVPRRPNCGSHGEQIVAGEKTVNSVVRKVSPNSVKMTHQTIVAILELPIIFQAKFKTPRTVQQILYGGTVK